jgi:hypothetical protein
MAEPLVNHPKLLPPTKNSDAVAFLFVRYVIYTIVPIRKIVKSIFGSSKAAIS